MRPHTDVVGRTLVGYREAAGVLEAVAARKRRKRDVDMQRTRITIRGVRIVRSAAGRPAAEGAGFLACLGLLCFLRVVFLFARKGMPPQGREADVGELRHVMGREVNRRRSVSDEEEEEKKKKKSTNAAEEQGINHVERNRRQHKRRTDARRRSARAGEESISNDERRCVGSR
jgi:hypothetical protein